MGWAPRQFLKNSAVLATALATPADRQPCWLPNRQATWMVATAYHYRQDYGTPDSYLSHAAGHR